MLGDEGGRHCSSCTAERASASGRTLRKRRFPFSKWATVAVPPGAQTTSPSPPIAGRPSEDHRQGFDLERAEPDSGLLERRLP